jgi:hypothetical protein
VTEDAAKRFYVAKDQYATRVTLKDGKQKLAQVYVGNAAGANMVYLRKAGNSTIEANDLSSWLLSTTADGWRDQRLLYLGDANVSKLVLPKLTLVRQKGDWQASGSKATLDQNRVQALVKQVAQMDFLDVVGKKDKAHPLQASFTVTLVDKTSKESLPLTYTFAKTGDKKNISWQMERSGTPFVFTVSQSLVDSLQGASIKSLVPPANKTKEPAKAVGKSGNKSDSKN